MIKLIENYEALGTLWYINIHDDAFGLKVEISNIKNEILEMINTFQKLYTRFDEGSLLNKYNRGEDITENIRREYNILSEYIDPYNDLMEMIRLGEKYNHDSDGVFDIYIKDKLETIGYGKSNNSNNNKNIDLGGIGKGYLIDKIKDFLLGKGIKYFLINGGGDIYLTSDNQEPIELYMEHPLEQGNYIYKIKLKDKAFCTSSSFKRSWEYKDKLYNHFVDSRKSINKNVSLLESEMIWAAAYVIGDNATVADVYATIACIDSEQIIKMNATPSVTSLDRKSVV